MGFYLPHPNQWAFIFLIPISGLLSSPSQSVGFYLPHPNQWAFIFPIPISGLLSSSSQSVGFYLPHPNHWAFIFLIPISGLLSSSSQSVGFYLLHPNQWLLSSPSQSVGFYLPHPNQWALIFLIPISGLLSSSSQSVGFYLPHPNLFHQPPGLCLSCLFFLYLRPCLIHARMPDWGRAVVHGHTFLHSWTHFLAFMEWADDIGLLHGATFLSWGNSWRSWSFLVTADDNGHWIWILHV